MYLDYSLKKTSILCGVVAMLFSGVYATNNAKLYFFGSTPYFYTIRIGTIYALQSLAAEFGKRGAGVFAAAAGAAFDATPAAAASYHPDAPAIPVLTYHRIVEDETDENNVTTSRFRDQMKALKGAGWRAISLEEFEAFMHGTRSLPEKSFLLTFDDGAKQSFYPVDPILRSLGFNAAIYIIVESSKTAESTYYLTPEEIHWLLSTGRWSVGSHSYDGHRPYGTDQQGNTGIFFADKIWNKDTGRPETSGEFIMRVRDDLSRAKQELEDTFDVPINTFAFPLGNETGIRGADNFPEGAAITEAQARDIYEFGFVQTNNQGYTSNFPTRTTAAFRPSFAATEKALATDFLVYRIHVDYDWDGERLLSLLENSTAKELPFEDDFTTNHGWIPAWGSLSIGRNNFELTASPETTSASTFLDGSALWDSYSFNASVDWQDSHALVLADVLDSKTYHSCAFSPGGVRVQKTMGGITTTLAEVDDERIIYGIPTLGIRVRGSVIECLWNFESIAEAYERDFSGGVGLQVWDPELGAARLGVSSVIARPYVPE